MGPSYTCLGHVTGAKGGHARDFTCPLVLVTREVTSAKRDKVKKINVALLELNVNIAPIHNKLQGK